MRRLIAGLGCAAAFALLNAGTAEAGQYTVHACDAAGGNANNSFLPYADVGMTAYARCGDEGLVARNVWDNGTALRGARAAMIFDAPPLTTILTMSGRFAISRHDCRYSTIAVASGPDWGGSVIGGYGTGTACDGSGYFRGPGYFPAGGALLGVGATRVRLETQCVPDWCTRDGVAFIRARDVRVTVQDNHPPAMAVRQDLWTRDGWTGGRRSIELSAFDYSGVRAQRVLVDGREIATATQSCDYTLRAPCPQQSDYTKELDTAGFGGDGEHRLRVEVGDAGGEVAAAEKTIRVDNTPPDPPEGVRVDGGDGWRPTNSFDVSWTNPRETKAPIDAAVYELCRTDGSDCTTRTTTGDGRSSLQDVAVPGAGSWTLRLWLRDSAGNADRRKAAAPVTLRYDDTSPTGALERLQADDPTRLAVATSDSGSGLAGGAIEVRRAGSALWRPQAVSVEGNTLVGRIADEKLLDGTYDLRARVADAAGNSREVTAYADGTPAQIQLPLRLKTGLRAGFRRKAGRKVRLARTASVRYGGRVRVSGRLTSTEGNPLQDTEVQAFTDVADGIAGARLIATVRTSRTGRFSFLVRRGPSRSVVVRYGGTSRVRSATRELRLDVRATSTIKPDKRRLVNGEVVRLAGRVTTGRIPGPGKLVELQVYVRGKWRTFATTRSGRRGGWSYLYRFDGTRGSQRYRFRVQVPREAGYPFTTGRSRVTAVRVRGQ